VVGLRGLELRTSHAVLSNSSLQSNRIEKVIRMIKRGSWADLLDLDRQIVS
jgi:hypothetical protein